METTGAPLPEWLVAAWDRSYIKRATADGSLGEAQRSVSVRYLQTQSAGHAFDLRLADGGALLEGCAGLDDVSLEQLVAVASGAVEGFAGVTIAERVGAETWRLRWHAAFCFPPSPGDGDEPARVLAAIAAGRHETEDVGLAVPTLAASRRAPVSTWIETAPDGTYEELWRRLEGFEDDGGAHVAALRPARDGVGASWLAILGSTFGFVRDVDRASLPASLRTRRLSDVLRDDAVSLEAKRRLFDSDFAFGSGGVVGFSALPWRRGVAHARLVGDPADWAPVAGSDAGDLQEALRAIVLDHEEACRALRDAEARGQADVADVLRARGAVVA